MEFLRQAPRRDAEDITEVTQRVAGMINDIRERGEAAVREYSRQLDNWDPDDFRVSDDVVAAAEGRISAELKEAIDFAQDQVRTFAQLQRDTLLDLEVETRPGVTLGHRHVPVQSVGAYVPGGRYALIASSYMSVIPARVAGVEKVVVATPARDGEVHPGLLYSAQRAGADAVYAVGGAQAIAALATGALPGLDPVDMVVGPGNRYVVEAKRQLFGQVGIDLLAGPTEIGIVADDSADPYIVACDLVGQAEHDPYSRAVLITTSRSLGEAVIAQMDEHLAAVSTEDVARQCWENGGEVILVRDEDELVAVSDDYALEHIEVLLREPRRMIDRLRHYGSLFVGEEATVAYGDKVSGPNHILPTLRAARFTGGLWVGKFLKTVTFQHMTREASLEMARYCDIEATAEGMVAHARTATVRIDRYTDGAGAARAAVQHAQRNADG
ncbi:MAG: histidinol dehydrogenase [Nitriliruptorales bacterium]|nr:histidinol dehydrogenase [Nitriliruptorales bacterium]